MMNFHVEVYEYDCYVTHVKGMLLPFLLMHLSHSYIHPYMYRDFFPPRAYPLHS